MAEQNQQNKNEEKDLNQLLKVRREKLKDLQDNGKAVSYTHLTLPTICSV